MVDVRLARRSETRALAKVLADAFSDSATFTWIEPRPDARLRMLEGMFLGLLRFGHPVHEGVLMVERAGEPIGAAIWTPPGRWDPSWWRSLLVSTQVLPKLDRESIQSFGTRGKAVDEALKKAHPSEPHWFLAGLGVAKAAAGTGAGSRMVQAGVERARAQNLPAYLECEEHLIPYYSRFGFEVRHEISMPPGAPAQVGMWRAAG